jgi:hypothetical protein
MNTTSDFHKARVGSVAMQVCDICGSHMGILLKRQGKAGAPEYTGPRDIAIADQHCEFCTFLGMYFAQEGKEEGVKYGAAKIVKENGELLAFVPFTDKEDRKGKLADGTEFEIRHSMVIEAKQVAGGFQLAKIMEEGL